MPDPGKSARKGITMFDLEKMFPNEDAARLWFEEQFWGKTGRCCPHCGSIRTHDAAHKSSPYRCSDCRGYFSVKTGTAMGDSRLPLRKWAFAIFLEVTSLKGIASMKLHRDIGVTQKTAWFMLHRIREAFALEGEFLFSGPVEVDETYVGGKRRNMAKSKRAGLEGRGSVGKVAVVGVKDRNTKESPCSRGPIHRRRHEPTMNPQYKGATPEDVAKAVLRYKPRGKVQPPKTPAEDMGRFLNDRQFGTILADPPWRFTNRTGKVAPEHKRLSRYETLSFEEIEDLPVRDHLKGKAHCYLWVPNALLPYGLRVLDAWGFEYKTNLVWHKIRKDGGSDGRGVGFYFRNVTEIILFGVRGKKARTLDAGRRQVNLFATRKREHSRKPDEQYEIMEQCSEGPYLELFGRGTRDGWTVWGNEADTNYAPDWDTYRRNSVNA